MENHHAIRTVNHLFLWAIYTMAMLNNQRVSLLLHGKQEYEAPSKNLRRTRTNCCIIETPTCFSHISGLEFKMHPPTKRDLALL
jgi:hypothetical protein